MFVCLHCNIEFAKPLALSVSDPSYYLFRCAFVPCTCARKAAAPGHLMSNTNDTTVFRALLKTMIVIVAHLERPRKIMKLLLVPNMSKNREYEAPKD